MNIIFLSLIKIDDIEERGIYTDLLRKMRDKGHNVYVVSPSERKFGESTSLKNSDSVQLLKVKIGNITKVNVFEKALSTITIGGKFKKAVQKYFSNVKFDLVIYATPPITFVKVIEYLKNRDNAYTYLLLKDIFPQNAVDLQMMGKNSFSYKYFRRYEEKLYDISDKIGVMSRANKNYLLRNNNLNENKIEVAPNSITPIDVNIDNSVKEKIRNRYKVPNDKVVYIYGGNLGKPQGIDFLIDCIIKNEGNKDTFILIVGSGTEFSKLSTFFNKNQPKNASLLSALPKEEYETLVNSADVGLLFLDNRFTIPNFPSRLLSYMEASMPVVAATDTSTDIGDVITQGTFGYWSKSGDVEAFNNNIQQLKDFEKIKAFGDNARCYLEKYYTTDRTYETIMTNIK